MRKWMSFLWMVLWLGPVPCLLLWAPTSFAAPREAEGPDKPEWDLGMIGCTYTQEEQGGLLTLLLETSVILPDRDGEWEIPIRILFNGELVEVDHRGKFKAAKDNLNQCPPQGDDGTCQNDPSLPCGTTTRTYKGQDIVFNWTCTPEGRECVCKRLLFFPATWVKPVSAPGVPGVFEFIIDPDNEVQEIDEDNNYLSMSYEPATSSIDEEALGSRSLRLVATGRNPFREEASFLLALASEADVRVEVLATGGRLVRTLAHGSFRAGAHRIDWDGTYGSGVEAGSGVYFVSARAADGRVVSQRVLKLE